MYSLSFVVPVGHPFFDTRAGLDSLRRLLSAFAVHNAEVGYCQGLNFIAGESVFSLLPTAW